MPDWGPWKAAEGEWGLDLRPPPLHWQEASRCLNKSKELMEAVLRDPDLLGLQREGGATLARLQQEASKLDFNPDVRYRHPVFPSPSPPCFLDGSWELGTHRWPC